MKTKRKGPYTILKETLKEAWNKVEYRHRVNMFYYSEANKDVSYSLRDLRERVLAADQLGYEVHMIVNVGGTLVAQYVKKVPARPFEIS